MLLWGKKSEMTDVEPVVTDFAASGRAGRRNALPDILGSSAAGAGTSELPLKLAELSMSEGNAYPFLRSRSCPSWSLGSHCFLVTVPLIGSLQTNLWLCGMATCFIFIIYYQDMFTLTFCPRGTTKVANKTIQIKISLKSFKPTHKHKLKPKLKIRF